MPTDQYLAKAEALAEFYQKRIDGRELQKRIDSVLKMTVPDYEKYLGGEKVFPFVKEELLALMNLGIAYSVQGEDEKEEENKDKCGGKRENRKEDKKEDEAKDESKDKSKGEKCLQAYNTVLKCLDAGYYGTPEKDKLQITVKVNLSKEYESRKMYEKAVELIDECMKLSVKMDYGHMLVTLPVSKACNYIKLAEKEGREGRKAAYYREAEEYLRQGYYCAAARGNSVLAKTIIDYK